jgi:hypothetical protein
MVMIMVAIAVVVIADIGDGGDFFADFDELHTRAEAVAQLVEVGFKSLAGGEQQFGTTHGGDVLGRWLEVMDVTAGLEDFDDFDLVATDLFREIGHDGMQRGDFERRGLTDGERQRKSGENGFHGGGWFGRTNSRQANLLQLDCEMCLRAEARPPAHSPLGLLFLAIFNPASTIWLRSFSRQAFQVARLIGR